MMEVCAHTCACVCVFESLVIVQYKYIQKNFRFKTIFNLYSQTVDYLGLHKTTCLLIYLFANKRCVKIHQLKKLLQFGRNVLNTNSFPLDF